MLKFVLLIDTTMSRFAVGSHIIVGRVNAQFGNDKMNAAIEAAFVFAQHSPSLSRSVLVSKFTSRCSSDVT